MRFKNRTQSGIPEVNLIPMLTVMMGILAFFALISMTLSAEQALNVPLPSNESTAAASEAPDPLIVKLSDRGEILVDDVVMTEGEAERRVLLYLEENQEGVVVFQAHTQRPYQEVLQVLEGLRSVGGDRISLAIDDP